MPQLLKPARLEPVLHKKRNHHREKPVHCNRSAPAPHERKPAWSSEDLVQLKLINKVKFL